MAVVKADAYGHGAIEIAKVLQGQSIEYFGVASIEEGVELRKAGLVGTILVLSEPPTYENIQDMFTYELTPTIYTLEFVKVLSAIAPAKLKVHLKLDTGMHRLGVDYKEAVQFIQSLPDKIQIAGVFSHLSAADEPKLAINSHQFKCFESALKAINNDGLIIHLCNSAGTFNFSKQHYGMVRCGISLYRNILSLKSYVNQVKQVKKGEVISYGGQFKAKKDLHIAIVSAGYADGIDRRLSNNGEVLIRGQRLPIIGRICMDLLIVDTKKIAVKKGDLVTLIGQDEKEIITAEEVAHNIKTIDYEILCGISKRVKRIYL